MSYSDDEYRIAVRELECDVLAGRITDLRHDLSDCECCEPLDARSTVLAIAELAEVQAMLSGLIASTSLEHWYGECFA